MARETITRYFCDFCGEQSAWGELTTIFGRVTGESDGGTLRFSLQTTSPGSRDPELCMNCYKGMLKAIAPFEEFIKTKGGRVEQKKEEAAHE